MPVPLFLASSAPGWEIFARFAPAAPAVDITSIFPASAEGWTIPPALLLPLVPLFSSANLTTTENYLAGLQAEQVLGAGVLPAGSRRRGPLAWLGVTLRDQGRKLFRDLRGGCWIPGFPAIGRGRELLRTAGIADGAGLAAAMGELGLPGAIGPELYFNIHDVQPGQECARVYVLDASARRLHAFALPPSALAPCGAK
jgi:hypothetical protein